MKKKLTKLDYAVIALGAVLLAGLVVLGIFMLKDSQRQKELEPSADYYGWTVLEAMYAECEVRGLSITAEEMVALEAQAKEDARQYALAGEEVSYEDCLEEAKFEFLFERLRTTLPLADNITKDDVQQWYDIRLEALNNAFAQEPGVFKSQQDQFDKHGGVEPLVVPEGYVYVRHILLEDLETAQLVLEKLNAGGDLRMTAFMPTPMRLWATWLVPMNPRWIICRNLRTRPWRCSRSAITAALCRPNPAMRSSSWSAAWRREQSRWSRFMIRSTASF